MAITNAAKVGTQGPFATMKAQGFLRISLDLDNSYVTGGYSGFLATVRAISGLENVTIVDIPDMKISDGTTWRTLHYDRSNNKLMVFNAETQIANGVDLSAYTTVEVAIFIQ